MPSIFSSMSRNDISSTSPLSWGSNTSDSAPSLTQQNEPEINADPSVLTYGLTHELNSNQIQQLKPDEYAFLFNRGALEAKYGRGKVAELEEKAYAAYNPYEQWMPDNRSPLRQASDLAAFAAKGALSTALAIPEVLGTGMSYLPGSIGRQGENIAKAFSDLNKQLSQNVIDKAFVSNYQKQMQRNNALADTQRKTFYDRQEANDIQNGDSPLMAKLKRLGTEISESAINALTDQGRAENLLGAGIGSIGGAAKIAKGVAGVGKKLAQSTNKFTQKVGKALTAGEDASFGKKLLTSESWAIGLTEGGGAVEDSFDKVNALTPEEILQSPTLSKEVQKHIKEGDTLEEAIDKTKVRLAASIARWQLPATMLTAMGLGVATDAISVIKHPLGKLSWNPLKTAKEAGNATIKEGAEEFGLPFADVAGNYALNKEGVDTSILEGIGTKAGESGVAGMLSGGALPIAGYAGRVAKLATKPGSAAYSLTLAGQRATVSNSIHTYNQAQADINQHNVSDDFKNLISNINSNIDFQNKPDIGRELSEASQKVYKDTKPVFENLQQMEKAAKKAEKQGNIEEANNIRQDIADISQAIQTKIEASNDLSYIATTLLQAKNNAAKKDQSDLSQIDKHQVNIYNALQNIGGNTLSQIKSELSQAYPQASDEELTRDAAQYINVARMLFGKTSNQNTAFDLSDILVEPMTQQTVALYRLQQQFKAKQNKALALINDAATKAETATETSQTTPTSPTVENVSKEQPQVKQTSTNPSQTTSPVSESNSQAQATPKTQASSNNSTVSPVTSEPSPALDSTAKPGSKKNPHLSHGQDLSSVSDESLQQLVNDIQTQGLLNDVDPKTENQGTYLTKDGSKWVRVNVNNQWYALPYDTIQNAVLEHQTRQQKPQQKSSTQKDSTQVSAMTVADMVQKQSAKSDTEIQKENEELDKEIEADNLKAIQDDLDSTSNTLDIKGNQLTHVTTTSDGTSIQLRGKGNKIFAQKVSGKWITGFDEVSNEEDIEWLEYARKKLATLKQSNTQEESPARQVAQLSEDTIGHVNMYSDGSVEVLNKNDKVIVTRTPLETSKDKSGYWVWYEKDRGLVTATQKSSDRIKLIVNSWYAKNENDKTKVSRFNYPKYGKGNSASLKDVNWDSTVIQATTNNSVVLAEEPSDTGNTGLVFTVFSTGSVKYGKGTADRNSFANPKEAKFTSDKPLLKNVLKGFIKALKEQSAFVTGTHEGIQESWKSVLSHLNSLITNEDEQALEKNLQFELDDKGRGTLSLTMPSGSKEIIASVYNRQGNLSYVVYSPSSETQIPQESSFIPLRSFLGLLMNYTNSDAMKTLRKGMSEEEMIKKASEIQPGMSVESLTPFFIANNSETRPVIDELIEESDGTETVSSLLKKAKQALKQAGITYFGWQANSLNDLIAALKGTLNSNIEKVQNQEEKSLGSRMLEEAEKNSEAFWNRYVDPMIKGLNVAESSDIIFNSAYGQALMSLIKTALSKNQKIVLPSQLDSLLVKTLLKARNKQQDTVLAHTITTDSKTVPEPITDINDLQAIRDMPESVREALVALFDGLVESNLLNSLDNPFESLDTLFNSLIPTWLGDTKDLAKAKKEFEKFFKINGQTTNLRTRRLIELLFTESEKDADFLSNLEALQRLFTPDSSVSLLYRLHEQFKEFVQSDAIPADVKKFQLGILEDIETAKMYFSAGNANGSSMLLTSEGNSLGTNENMLQRVSLAMVSAYLTMHRERNVRDDKDSLDLPEFRANQHAREELTGTVGRDVETAQHILVQLQGQLRDFLGFSAKPSSDINSRQRVLSSVASSMFSVMMTSGLFSLHQVEMVSPKNAPREVSRIGITSFTRKMNDESWSENVHSSVHANKNTETVKTLNFVTVNNPNAKSNGQTFDDPTLHKLAGKLSTTVAFALQNMILQKVNDNVFFSSQDLQESQKDYATLDEKGNITNIHTPMTIQHQEFKATNEQTRNALELERIPLYFNSWFASFLLNTKEEDLLEFFDVVFDEEYAREVQNHMANQSKKGEFIGMQTQIRDAKDLLHQLKTYVRAHAKEGITTDNAPMFIKRAISSMGRYMMQGGANTQASKLLRELFINREDPSKPYQLNNTAQYSFLLRSIAAGFGVDIGSIPGGFEQANEEILTALEKKAGALFKTNAWEKFVATVNSADGDISKRNAFHIGTNLQRMNQKTTWSDETAALLKELKTSGASVSFLSINACVELAHLMGALGVQNVKDIAQLKDTPFILSDAAKNYRVSMYIENDGLNSGPSHAFHLLTTTPFTATQLRMMAATGFSYIPGTVREAKIFAGRDIYERTADIATNWVHSVFTDDPANAVSLVQALNSWGTTNEDTRLEYSFEDSNGNVVRKIVEPTDILQNILTAMQQTYVGINPGEAISIKDLVDGIMQSINFDRNFSKDSIIMYTYQAGARAIATGITKAMFKAYYDKQTKYNVLQDKVNQKKATPEEEQQLSNLEKEINYIALALRQACAVRIGASSYEENSIKPTFDFENSFYAQVPAYFMPAKQENGLYDVSFSVPVGAQEVFTNNLMHLMINPLIKGIEEQIYDKETISNKKMLTGIHNFMGTVYEGIESYYIAQAMKLAARNNHSVSQEDLNLIRKRMKALRPSIEEKFDIAVQMLEQETQDGQPSQDKEAIIEHLNAELFTIVSQNAGSILRNDFGNIISQEEVNKALASGSSLFQHKGIPSTNAELDIRSHASNSVSVILQMIQGFAEAGIIAAAAKRGFAISDQYDGVNVALGEHTQYVTQYNNGAAAHIWMNIDVFGMTLHSLGKFLNTINNGNPEFKTVLESLLTANHVTKYEEKVDGHEQHPDTHNYSRKNLNQASYKYNAPRGLNYNLSGYQERLARNLYSLAKELGISLVQNMSYNMFKMCLFEMTPDASLTEQEKTEINNKLKERNKIIAEGHSLLEDIMLEMNLTLGKRSKNVRLRKKAENALGDVWVDNLRGLGKAYKLSRNTKVTTELPNINARLKELADRAGEDKEKAKELFSGITEEMANELNRLMAIMQDDEDLTTQSLSSDIHAFISNITQGQVQRKLAEIEAQHEQESFGEVTNRSKLFQSLNAFTREHMSRIKEIDDALDNAYKQLKDLPRGSAHIKDKQKEINTLREAKRNYNYVFALVQTLTQTPDGFMKDTPIILLNTKQNNWEEHIRNILSKPEYNGIPDDTKEAYIQSLVERTKQGKSWQGLTTWHTGTGGTKSAIFINIAERDAICQREGIKTHEYLPYVLLHEIMHVSFDRIVDQHISFENGKYVLSQSLEQQNPVAYQMLNQLLTMYAVDANKIINSMPEGDEKTNAQRLMQQIQQQAPMQAFKEFIAWSLSYSSLNKALQQKTTEGQLSMPYRLTVIDETHDIAEHKKMGKFEEFLKVVGDKIKALIKRLFTGFKAFTPKELHNADNPKFFESALASLTWSLQTLSQTNTFAEQTQYSISGSESSAMEDPVSTIQRSHAALERQEREKLAENIGIANQVATVTSGISSSTNRAILENNIRSTWKAHILAPYTDSTRNLYQSFAFAAKEILPYISEEIFYESENPSEQEIATAQQMNNVIHNLFNQTNKNKYSLAVPYIVSLAQTNEKLHSILETKTLPKNTFETGTNHTFDNFIKNQGIKFNDWLTQKLYPEANQNVSLAQMLQNLDSTSETILESLADNLPDVNKRITQVEEKVANKMRDVINDLFESSETFKKILGYPASIATDTQLARRTQRQVISSTNIGILSTAPKIVQKIIQEIMGPQWKDLDMHILKKMQKTAVEQIRQSFRQQMPSNIRMLAVSQKLTKPQWESLTRSLAGLALHSFSRFSPELVQALPKFLKQNSSELQIAISLRTENLAKELKVSERQAKELLAKTQQLGRYMATGEAGNMLQKNAFAVYLTTTNAEPTEDQEAKLNVLASLYALENMSFKDRQMLSNLLTNDKTGVQNLLQLLAATRNQEEAKLSAMLDDIEANGRNMNNPMYRQYLRVKLNHYQNYIPMLPIRNASLIIAKDEDENSLKRLGYVKQGSYDNALGSKGKGKYSYYYSTLATQAGVREGLFNTASPTYMGVFLNTGTSVQGTDADVITDKSQITKIMQSKQQTVNGDYLTPIYEVNNGVVQITGYERAFNTKQKAMLFKNIELPDMIGVMQGRQFEEIVSRVFNYKVADLVVSQTNENELKECVDLTDYQHLNPIQREAVSRIPSDVYKYMRQLSQDRGLGDHIYVRKDLLDDVIGYRKFSLAEAFHPEKSDYNQKFLQRVEKGLTAICGKNAIKIALRGEEALQGVVSWAKASIVVRSVKVCLINAVGNIYHLHANGVSFGEMIKYIPYIFAECEKYAESFKRARMLDTLISMAQTDAQKQKLLDQKKAEELYIQSLSIAPIIDEFSIINDLARSAEDLALVRGQMGEWLQDYVVKNLPDAVVNTGRYAFMTQDTSIFEGLQKATQYGDFIAKAILYRHWVKTGKYNSLDARKRILTEFVDYDRNAGRTREYIESMGLAWFLNYKLRIMAVAQTLVRDHPLRALMTATLPHPSFAAGDTGSVLSDSLIGKLLSDDPWSNIGFGFLKLAWDSLPLWWIL